MSLIPCRIRFHRFRSTFSPLISSGKRRRFACLLVVVALASSPSFAGQWPSHPLPTRSADLAVYEQAIGLRPSMGVCLDESGGTTPGIRDCLAVEHEFQDRRLNESYRKLMASLSEATRKHLRGEGRRWLVFRDALCAPGSEPGQGQVLESAGCRVAQTADRATELELRLNQGWGTRIQVAPGR